MRYSVTHVGCAAVVFALGPTASLAAPTWTPTAFSPLASGNQNFNSILDIAGDGLSFLAQTTLGSRIFRTPQRDYTLTGTGLAYGMSRDGQTVVGGVGSPAGVPQRWRVSAASGASIASENITWPGGPANLGISRYVNADGTAFTAGTANSNLGVITTSGYETALADFQILHASAQPTGFRGLAADAPVVLATGSVPGSTSNVFRWDYGSSTVQALPLPTGGSSISLSMLRPLSADGTRVAATVSVGGQSRPVWWDDDNTAAVLPLPPAATAATLNSLNYTGTLAGGGMTVTGQGQRAVVWALDETERFDLNAIYSSAGLLPAGWTLTNTQHISDDGSRIFCLATAPDNSQRAVMLTGTFLIPAPGSGLVFAALAPAGLRRRSRSAWNR